VAIVITITFLIIFYSFYRTFVFFDSYLTAEALHKDGGQALHKDGGQALHKDGGQAQITI